MITIDRMPECWLQCDADCEIGSMHCEWWHRGRSGSHGQWHDPHDCRALVNMNGILARPTSIEIEIRAEELS